MSKINDIEFTWTQSFEEVLLSLPVEPNMAAKSVNIDFRCTELKIQLGDRHLQEVLENTIVYKECMWYLDGESSVPSSRSIRLVLIKANPGIVWQKVFSNQCVSLTTIEGNQTKKALLLERFAMENPDFDFSQADISGECVPDARSFLGGITL